LLAIVKKELKLERSLSEIQQIVSVNLFEKTPIFQALSCDFSQNDTTSDRNQLLLFNL